MLNCSTLVEARSEPNFKLKNNLFAISCLLIYYIYNSTTSSFTIFGYNSGHELTTLNRWANQNVVFPIIWGVVRTSIVRFDMTSRRLYLCTKQWIGGHVCVQKKILWELNSFHMLKLSFIPSNLQSSCCWPRDWKRSMKQPLFKNTVLPPKVCMTIEQFLRLYNFLRDDFRHQETMQTQNIGGKARSVVFFFLNKAH